ncbi:hypothetical protein L6452_18451 [Arctium lappa]|uniref:Uncharacterized protein n=1 Tax=Arctium lappa TaxID=4217 RepID=A0ACB9C6J0_ARCLA|nr:hypothetical protein L6452_18451 [Arctium lappa]
MEEGEFNGVIGDRKDRKLNRVDDDLGIMWFKDQEDRNFLVHVDCVIFDDDTTFAFGASDKSRGPFSSIVRLVVGEIVKPIQALAQFLGSKRSSSLTIGNNIDGDDDDLEVMVNNKVVDGDEKRE